MCLHYRSHNSLQIYRAVCVCKLFAKKKPVPKSEYFYQFCCKDTICITHRLVTQTRIHYVLVSAKHLINQPLFTLPTELFALSVEFFWFGIFEARAKSNIMVWRRLNQILCSGGNWIEGHYGLAVTEITNYANDSWNLVLY